MDRIDERLVYLINPLVPVHFDNLPLIPIIVQQVNSLIEKDIQATLYRCPKVVSALVKLAAIQITFTSLPRRTRVDVINVLVSLADITPGEPLQQFLARN